MKRSLILLSALCLMLVLPGCSLLDSGTTVARRPMAVPTAAPVMPALPQQQASTLPDGWERRSIRYEDGRDAVWIVAPFKPGDWTWSLENSPSKPQTVKDWRRSLKTDLVINGAYFDVDFTPAGYYQTGKTNSAHAWPDKRQQADPKSYSGMVKVTDGKLQLTHLVSQPQARPADHESILLSYPTLVSDGQALVKEDTQKYARRTILAQDATGTAYVIVTERGAVSLYEASLWLAAQPERFRVAINLDGGPSTGLSYSKDGRDLEIESVPVPNVITASLIEH